MRQLLLTPRRRASPFPQPRARHSAFVLVAGALAIALYVALADSSLAGALLYASIAALAALVLATCAALSPAATRPAWILIAGSQVSWALGDSVWTALELSGDDPYPSVADVLYVLGYPLLAVGLGLLLRSASKGFGLGDVIDVAIITLASGLALWPVVFQPTLAEGLSSATLASLAYSTGDILLLGLLAALFVQGGRRSIAIWLLAGSLSLVFAADVVYYLPTLSGSADGWSSVAWLTAYVLIAAAGLHPSARRTRIGQAGVESSPVRRLRFVGFALLTMPAVFAVDELTGSGTTDWRAIVAINAAVAVLVILRLSTLFAEVDGARREAFAARNRFETVFESVGLGMTISEGGRLFRTNPAFQELVGYTSQELSTMSIVEIVHPDERDSLVDPATLEDGGRATFGRRLVHREGSVVHAIVNLTFSAETGMAIAVFENVTGRKELEEQMQEAQRLEAVGRLAGGIAHDFNNILTVVSGHTELLRDHLPPAADPDVRTILDAVRRANDLTRQLLTFSRRRERVTTVIDPVDIFRDTEALIRNVVGGTVRLSMHVDESAPAVAADASQLGQVVLNLAVNARDAMPDGGDLTFTVDSLTVGAPREELPGVLPGLYCRVAVEDTGCGMDDATRTRVFEPFFTTKQVGKGTGLGLATTYGIVSQAGGHIFVESQVGQGTRFQILLPAANAVPALVRPLVAA